MWTHSAAPLVICALMAVAACNTSPQAQEARFLRRGAVLFRQKDYTRALLELKNASAAVPRDAEPYYQAGLVYLAMGNLPNGIAALRRATELNPRHERAQLKLAELMASTHSKELVEQAFGRLRDVASTSPENEEASDALALAEWKLGRSEEAVGHLEETLRNFPKRLQSSVELARMKLSKGDLAAAEQVLKQAVAAAPESSAAELALGELYMLANEGAKAEAELRKAVVTDPKNGIALLAIGALEMSGGRMAEAEETYRRVSALPDRSFRPMHASFLYTIGKKEAALAEFEMLAREAPGDAGARTRLVAAYLALGREEPANALLTAALKKNPKDSEALMQRAGLLLGDGHVEEAAEDLKSALQFRPDWGEAHVAMAKVYAAQNRTLSERRELNEALRIKPALLDARIALVRSLMQSNNQEAALDLLNAAPPEQKNSLTVAIERNWVLLATGKARELRAELDRELRVRRVPDLLLQDAWLRLDLGDSAGARAAAENVLQIRPENLPALRIAAESYRVQKQDGKGEEVLRSAAASHPGSAQLENLLGEWYETEHNPAGARKAFEAAVQANPNSVPPAISLARMDAAEGRSAAARERLLGIVSQEPGNATAWLMLGGVALDAGDVQGAAGYYRKVLNIDDSNVMALNNLAYIMVNSNADEALQLASRAGELAPDNPSVQDTLGWIYYRRGMFRAAVQHLEVAVRNEQTPRREFHLGLSYLKCGEHERGEKALQAALREDPRLSITEQNWR